MAASQANSLPSRVIWAASGAGSAPRQPALRTALPAPQYRLHLRHIASGCSHRRCHIASPRGPSLSRSGCRAALPLVGGAAGGAVAPGRTRGSTNPPHNPTGPPAPEPGCPLAMGMGGRDAIASSCILGKRAWRRAGRAGRPGWTPPQTRAPPCQHRRQLRCSPETESRAPLLCRVSPLYLCLVIHL